MSTQLRLFGEKRDSTQGVDIAEQIQCIPLVWFALFVPSDLKKPKSKEPAPITLSTSVKSALQNLEANAPNLETLVSAKGECRYAAELLGEAVAASGMDSISVDLLDFIGLVEMHSNVDELYDHLHSALCELVETAGFEDLSGVSAVDDYKTIKLSKEAMQKGVFTEKDREALGYLIGAPLDVECRWHDIVFPKRKTTSRKKKTASRKKK